MSNEDKQLLLTDLCGRLPYNVKGRVFTETSNGDYDINGDMIFIDTQFVVVLDQVNIQTEEISVTAVGDEKTVEFIDNEQDFGKPYCIEDFKPYLRPLNTITDTEVSRAIGIITGGVSRWSESDKRWYYIVHDPSIGEIESDFDLDYFAHGYYGIDNVDFLNSHRFDYRGLIEKGLALPAPEGMYND